MFKVRSVEISGIGPFRKTNPQTFHFGPFFTLLRGQSGAGKTTVLEVLALLGHCNVMRFEAADADTPSHTWDRFAGYSLVIGKCPLGEDKRLGRLSDLWNRLLGGRDAVEIKIWIRLPHDADNRDEVLDSILSKESLLERCFITGEPAEVEFLREVIAFSRPRQKLSLEKARERRVQGYLNQSFANVPGNIARDICEAVNTARPEYEPTPRSALLGAAGMTLPPLVCYFNTDLHQAGLGLDIRESPKRLSEELMDLLCRRLQVVDADGRVANEKEVRAFWSDVNLDPNGPKRDSTLLIRVEVGKEAQVAIVEESLHDIALEPGGKKARKIIREFVSSGENQILFLSLILGTLKPLDSILLLDEPDLHMSLPTAMKMFNLVYQKAIQWDMQVITASHLSVVFPASLHAEDALLTPEAYFGLYQDAREEYEAGGQVSRCVTLHWLSKEGERVEVESQEAAAARAGRYQNYSLDSILRQCRFPTEKRKAASIIARTFPGFKIPSFGFKRKGSGSRPVKPFQDAVGRFEVPVEKTAAPASSGFLASVLVPATATLTAETQADTPAAPAPIEATPSAPATTPVESAKAEAPVEPSLLDMVRGTATPSPGVATPASESVGLGGTPALEESTGGDATGESLSASSLEDVSENQLDKRPGRREKAAKAKT